MTGATSEAGTAYPSGAPAFKPVFSGVRVTRSLVLCVCFVDRCLSFFFWSLCCLFFFDIRIMITPLVSSNFSFELWCLASTLAIFHLYRDVFDSMGIYELDILPAFNKSSIYTAVKNIKSMLFIQTCNY